jgi:hypothetical protein
VRPFRHGSSVPLDEGDHVVSVVEDVITRQSIKLCNATQHPPELLNCTITSRFVVKLIKPYLESFLLPNMLSGDSVQRTFEATLDAEVSRIDCESTALLKNTFIDPI